MEIELEMGGFYTCVQDGFEPVVIWIGRVDLPEDLGPGASEPVVSFVLQSALPDQPIISHAPFWESIALDGELQHADPFDVNEDLFNDHYNIWRSAFERSEAFPWAMTPNEVYAKMLDDLTEALTPDADAPPLPTDNA
jgi:hypothetical protein